MYYSFWTLIFHLCWKKYISIASCSEEKRQQKAGTWYIAGMVRFRKIYSISNSMKRIFKLLTRNNFCRADMEGQVNK